MVNFNGALLSEDQNLMFDNRAFLYGDGVFETVKIVDNQILFLEDHYFRLMSAMRIVRMQIPMDFTMEYFENQMLSVAAANNCQNSARARITVYRNSGGFYLPNDNSVSYLIHAASLKNTLYSFGKSTYEVDLYKDFFITKHLLSTIKTTNKLINITGSIYAYENGLDNCLLLNESKIVVEALNGNIFMLTANKLITPPITEGCLNGIMRKQVLAIAKKSGNLEVAEEAISPFDLQKADELFITNVIIGIQPITKYRKKEYSSETSGRLSASLNAMVGSLIQ